VPEPQRPDGGETDDVAEITWPLLTEGVKQVLHRVRGGRDGQVQDQQRDGNGEYSVAERFKARLRVCLARSGVSGG
jgi:hypothetical protein